MCTIALLTAPSRRLLANLFVAGAVGGLCAATQPAFAAELVSLHSREISRDEHVWGFDIHLREGRIVSLCHVPEGWTISVENYGEAGDYKDGGGELKGNADFDHDTLTAKNLVPLEGIFLIDRSEVHHKRATLSGFLTTSDMNGNRKLELEAGSFARAEADRCPTASQ
jgi:hypothetical protein